MIQTLLIDGEANVLFDLDGEANAFYDKGIHPTGTKEIEDNGTYDVTDFAEAEVRVYARVGSAIVKGD